MKKIKSWLKNNWKQIFLVVFLILVVGYVMDIKGKEVKLNDEVKVFEYKGEEGKDALTLLKEKTEVELDNVGMVVSIDGTKVNSEKREFWAFYVNDQMAQVGAADYQTKEGDIIDWKIENY
jgi:hypothetical protein